ncbi:MAG TPA: hypothetical protein VHM27_01660 [Rhizomicrobium sp.]|nr:hypothetical protein [Rhizomicrobium sp.]
MVRQFAVPVELENPEPANSQTALPAPGPRVRATGVGRAVMIGGVLLSLFWMGTAIAFVSGWLGFFGLAAQPTSTLALIAAAIFLPPFLFIATAVAIARSAAMSEATHQIIAAADRLFAADETAANNAARLARLVRRELDGLNNGLDAAFQRIRTMEMVLEKQIATLDDAGARAQVRGDTIASRLSQESQRIEALGDGLSEAASRVGETVAGRAAQLRAMIESAEGTLKMASQSLDVQSAAFRGAITQAAEAPLEAAKSLEVQAARIEEVADTAMGRAEFVLARQEKHRSQMQDLLQRLREEGDDFDAALSQQRDRLEKLIQSLDGEAERFQTVTGDTERHLEVIMSNAAERAAQLTGAFSREAERLKETSEAAASILAGLSAALQDAGTGAQTLIGESAAQARQDARNLVGEAMAECERLLRTSGELSAEVSKIRGLLSDATRDVEKHLTRLPDLAQEEARRVRQMVATEPEQMLDLSARAMATLHARASKPAPVQAETSDPVKAQTEAEAEGLKGLARKLTTRKSEKSGRKDESKGWEMKALLAAAEQGEVRPLPVAKSGIDTAIALGALEGALADMAINLSALDDVQPGDGDWKRYLAGDRAVFARRLADTIDSGSVDRITSLYRDDKQFHDAADAYLGEFETLLAQAREGNNGLLTSTLLSADTGKVYLAIAYALGRL